MDKTIKDAVKFLPPQYRQTVEDMWAEAGCMDLYDGNLTQYLQVIFSILKRRREQIAERDEQLKAIKKILKG